MKTGIQIVKTNDIGKLKELISVFERVFEMEEFKRPSEAYLHELLNKETFFAVVAVENDKVVAGLTFYVLNQYYSEKPLAYLYDLAVLPEYQRKGIGKNLIEFTIKFCQQRGFEEVFVQAEKVDEQAIDFYHATKPADKVDVLHFAYKL